MPARHAGICTVQGADWYEFLPSSFALLNANMHNREVVSPVP